MRLIERAEAGLARIGGPTGAVLLGMLLLSAARFPGLTIYLRESLPVLRLWADPEAQRRAAAVDYPFDLLRQAGALLPREAGVLLVTSGRDVRRSEYTTYHRALYYLTPRSVWWLAPALLDGTWEARWWISAPATADAIRAVAGERGAKYVLGYGLPPPSGLGVLLAEWHDGYLLQLAPGAAPAASRPEIAERVDTRPLWPARLAAALAIPFALGYALLSVTARWGFAARGVEAAALAWLLGAGGVSLGMFWLDRLGLPLGSQAAALTALAALALAARLLPDRLRRDRLPRPHALRITDYELRFTFYVLRCSLYALLAAHILLAALLALGRPLTVWDSWAHWGVKARTIFLEGGITAAVTADIARAVTHLDYPLMLPLLQAWLYTWIGAPDDRLAALIPLLFYLALGGIVYGGARRLGAEAGTALAAAVALMSVPHIVLPAGFAFADAPLAALAAAAGVYLLGWLQGGPSAMLLVAALAAGLMPWMKREGLVLLAALTVAAVVAGRASRRAWTAGATVIGAAAALAGPWWAQAAGAGRASADFLPPSLAALAANAGRLPVVAGLAIANMAAADWLFLWPLAGLLALARSRRGAERMVHALPLAALLYLAALGFAFVFSAYAPYQQHVLAAWPRLAAHVAPLVVLWLAGQSGPDSAPAEAGGEP